MPSTRFEPTAPDIRVWVRLIGLRGAIWCEMVLDTGSSRTVVDESVLLRLGYNLAEASSATIAAPTGMAEVSIVTVQQIDALGLTVHDFPVLAMPLIVPLRTEGLLGLDFLRRRNLFCNFAKGILLTLPYPRNLLQRFTLTAQLFANL
ncbi:MAG: retroviral-like aspartic protease family protein [Armatimonadetes bacterium]|nr:retroviral-like aspartic protease family protein [Armatimonadota bacterium]